MSDRDHEDLLMDILRGMHRFFWENTNLGTGLTLDRVSNDGNSSEHYVASIATTGYTLTDLVIATNYNLISESNAKERAKNILDAIGNLFHDRGWMYHFMHIRSGEPAFNREISTVDTVLMVLGVLCAGSYFGGNVESKAQELYRRVDFEYMRTNDGTRPDELTLSHGRISGEDFLGSRWDTYSEGIIAYILGLGSSSFSLPEDSWSAWKREVKDFNGHEFLGSGPSFIYQMPHGFFDFRNRRDKLGFDYWESALEYFRAQIEFCSNHGFYNINEQVFWGMNASDKPKGKYGATEFPDGPFDGVISPTAIIAALPYVPEESERLLRILGSEYKHTWGKYGPPNAISPTTRWYSKDVVAIDLGMAEVMIANHQKELIWSIMMQRPEIIEGMRKAGFTQYYAS